MKYFFKSMLLFIAGSALTFAADKTLTGQISDSMCGASHAKMAAAHPGTKMTERDCTLACIKMGGKYVFAEGGKVYTIANQDFAGLQEHAGETVRLTGDIRGDSITVSKITSAGKKKS